ncbi:PAS domain S-box protein [Gloeothece verrucosa]|uniref:histidine kinase n=1 Tax=Gloeothece verrucosa (strain PCC 7822) TaxID=497965 RepID=E0UIS7_GLOV7|nr:PAS domain S-box protein [Gloeothece verrucosa]ADN13386.1 multi-sensor signal transduction histidine kinase [Gloeothece verrucosa PCC 7822]
MFFLPLNRPLPKISLRWVLIVPFVLQIVGAVGLVGYFSYRSGQQAVEKLADQLLEKVSERVSDHLDKFLEAPHDIVATNHLAAQQGLLNIKDLNQLQQQFWQQIRLYPLLGTSNFWNEQGEAIGYGRIQSTDDCDFARQVTGENISLGTIFLQQVKKTQPDEHLFYLVDGEGKARKLVYKVVKDYRQIDWYLYGKKSGKQGWVPIAVSQITGKLQTAAVAPIYNAAGQFQGMFTSIFSLSDISTFLNDLNISPSAQLFIIERSGDLVATSTLETPHIKQGKQTTRLPILNSTNPSTREIAQQLLKKFGSFKNLQKTTQLDLSVQNEHHFVQVTPYQDKYGLDWLIVVVVPRSDLMTEINDNVWHTIIISSFILLGVIIIGILTANWIARPIRRLSQASQVLAEGNWQHSLKQESVIREISLLTQSFNLTAAQLQQSFEQIKTALQQSEEKFTKVFRSCPDPISINSLMGGYYLDVNESFLEFSEYTREEIIGKTAAQLNFIADAQQDAALGEKLQKYGVVKGFEFDYRTKTGKLGTALLSIELVELDGELRVLTISKDITDRKQLEIALQASQTQLDDILNYCVAAITSFRVLADKNWSINYLSAGCQAISGYSAQELKADKDLWVARIAPEDWQAIEAELFANIFAQQVGTYEYRFYHKNGTLRWFSQTNSSRWDEKQNCWIVTAVTSDISERKQTEEALQKSEFRFQQLASASPGVIYTVVEYPDGPVRYEYVSPAFEEIHEVPLTEILKDASITINQMHPDDLSGYQQAVVESLKEMQPFRHEWRIITPSGQVKWIQAHSRPERRENGEIAWHGVVLDITEKKQVEAQLRKTEQWLCQFNYHAPSVIYTIVQEADGLIRFEYISSACEAINELTAEQVLENAHVLLELIHPDDRATYGEAVAKSAESLELFDHQWRIITPSGKVKWLQGKSQPERRSNGAIAWYGVVIDITERKQIEARLQEQEIFLRSIYEGVEEPIFVIDVDENEDFRFVSLNPAHQRAVGFSLSEIYGKTPQEAQVPAWEAITQHYRDCLAARTTISYQENVFLHGRETSWYTTLTPLCNLEGRIFRIIGTALEITELKRTERALKQALQQIDAHFENSPLGIVQWDKSFHVLRWSKQAEQMFGWSAEEVKSHFWQDWNFVHREDQDLVNAVTTAFMNGLITNQTIINRNVTKEGRVMICQWDSSAVFDEMGNLVSVLSFVQDITERKQAELELQKQKELRETIFNESTDAIFLVDPHTLLITDCNRRAVELFEVPSKDDLIGTEGRSLQRYPFTTEEIEQITQEMDEKGFWSLELEYITGKGNLFWGNIAAKPFVIADMRVNLIRVTDINTRKRAQEALRESEERFRRAFEDAAIGMALVNLHRRFLKVNRSLCEMIGYSEAELLRLTFEDITHPDDLETNLAALEQMLKGEYSTYQVEKRYLHQEGRLIWAISSVSLIKDQDHLPLYYVVQIQDISERHKLDRMKDEFISIVSHELRTPLTAIRGSLGILESGVLNDEPLTANRMLKVALNNSERLARLVNDILDLERLESGKTELVMKPCQVSDLMEQAVESVEAIANLASIRINFTAVEAQVWADFDAIVQTLINLLGNGIKFSDPGSMIWLKAQRSNGEWGLQKSENFPHLGSSYLLFSIEDQGRGIPSDKLESIFGRFQQVDVSDSRQKGGTGLGLAICKSIIEQHNGKIWVESVVGQGSIFYFTLPLWEQEPPHDM